MADVGVPGRGVGALILVPSYHRWLKPTSIALFGMRELISKTGGLVSSLGLDLEYSDGLRLCADSNRRVGMSCCRVSGGCFPN